MDAVPIGIFVAIGTLAVLLVGMLGGIIARDRQVMKMIHDGDEKNATELKKAEGNIHDRINRTKDSFRSDMNEARESAQCHFVNKDHFESCITGLQASLKSVDGKLDRLLEKYL